MDRSNGAVGTATSRAHEGAAATEIGRRQRDLGDRIFWQGNLGDVNRVARLSSHILAGSDLIGLSVDPSDGGDAGCRLGQDGKAVYGPGPRNPRCGAGKPPLTILPGHAKPIVLRDRRDTQGPLRHGQTGCGEQPACENRLGQGHGRRCAAEGGQY